MPFYYPEKSFLCTAISTLIRMIDIISIRESFNQANQGSDKLKFQHAG
jgi:hypothetical protein